MGMPSITKSVSPLPKVRVTRRNSTPGRPHEAHSGLDEVDRDDVENAREADFDNCFGLAVVEGAAADDNFRFAGFPVFLTLDDGTGEEDVFEIEDREVFIFQLFSSVNGYNVVQRTN